MKKRMVAFLTALCLLTGLSACAAEETGGVAGAPAAAADSGWSLRGFFGRPGCEHAWTPATCITRKTCTLCGKKEGGTAEHVYVNMVCTYCGEKSEAYYEELREALKKVERYVSYGTYNYSLVESSKELYRLNGSSSALGDISTYSTEIFEYYTTIVETCGGFEELRPMTMLMREEDLILTGPLDDRIVHLGDVAMRIAKEERAAYLAMCDYYGVSVDIPPLD